MNITNGASKISGTLIRPGETFSLTEALGPIDAAHGYVEAGAIVSGEHTDAWGGGLSQVSTTTYNAAFLAGLRGRRAPAAQRVVRALPRGPRGDDLHGHARHAVEEQHAVRRAGAGVGRRAGACYVRMWGTKYWTVESITSPRSGVVAPTTVYSQSPTCEPQSARATRGSR